MTDDELAAEFTRVLDALDKCRADITSTHVALVDNVDKWSPSAIAEANEHLGRLGDRLIDLYQEREPLAAEFRRRGLGEPVPPEVTAQARTEALVALIEETERSKQNAERAGLVDPQVHATMDAFIEKLRQGLRDPELGEGPG